MALRQENNSYITLGFRVTRAGRIGRFSGRYAEHQLTGVAQTQGAAPRVG